MSAMIPYSPSITQSEHSELADGRGCDSLLNSARPSAGDLRDGLADQRHPVELG